NTVAETHTSCSITAAAYSSATGTSAAGPARSPATPSSTVAVDTDSATQAPVITGNTGGVMTVCAGDPLQLTTSSSEPVYAWTGPNGFASSDQNPLVNSVATNAMAGLYELELQRDVCRSNKATVRVDVVNLLG